MDKAIVLLSGGLNSTVAAAQAKTSHDVYAVFVNLHQRPLNRELRAYEALCQFCDAKHHWKVELTHFKQVGGSAYIESKRAADSTDAPQRQESSVFVAGLIPTLLNVAVTFAYRIGARKVITGIAEGIDDPPPGTAQLFPDNRRQFLTNYQYMLDSALPENQRIVVHAPMIDFDRSEIIKLGQRFEVPFASTWSCYEGDQAPCGVCYGCRSRAAGFIKAGIPDPLL